MLYISWLRIICWKSQTPNLLFWCFEFIVFLCLINGETKWIAQIESKVPGGNWRNDGYKFKGKFLANYSHIRTSILYTWWLYICWYMDHRAFWSIIVYVSNVYASKSLSIKILINIRQNNLLNTANCERLRRKVPSKQNLILEIYTKDICIHRIW